MFLLLFIQLSILILLEEPFPTIKIWTIASSLALNSGNGGGLVQACELVILLVILVRFFMYFRIYGWDNFKHNVWKILVASVLLLSIVESIVSVFFPAMFRLSRILRYVDKNMMTVMMILIMYFHCLKTCILCRARCTHTATRFTCCENNA